MSDFTLRGRTIAAYVLPGAPLSALGLPLVVYVQAFYIQGLGLDPSGVAFVMLAARLLDLIIDPLIGWAGDQTRTRWGRRKPWMLVALPPLVAAVYMLFLPPEDATIGWFACWVILSYLAYSVAAITHIAWGAELSASYHERSRVQGWREFAIISGMVLVLSLPVLLDIYERQVFGHPATLTDQVALMGWFIVLVLPVAFAVCVLFVPEPKLVETRKHKLDVAAAVMLIASNAALRRLLLADLFQGLAPGITGAMFLWLIHFYFKVEGGTLLLFIYFIAGLVFVPLWINLSYRISKHRTLATAMIYGALTLPVVLILPIGNFPILVVVFILYGVAYGAAAFLLRSIMADVIDIDTLATGRERSGLFYSLLVMTNKLGFAGAALAPALLQMIGFDARLGNANTPEAVYNMALFFVIVPAAFMLLTARVVWNFPIDKFKQQELREAIARRRAEETLVPKPAE